MKLEPIIQSEVSQKEKHQYSILNMYLGILTEAFKRGRVGDGDKNKIKESYCVQKS